MILENRYHFGVATWSEQALSELRAAGYRRGLARARVIDFLDAQDCCVGAQEIHRELVARGERIGLASVYPAFGFQVALDQQAPEQDPDADVRERADREQPVRRVDQLADLRMLFLNAVDDRTDRPVDEWDPGLFELAHHCEG